MRTSNTVIALLTLTLAGCASTTTPFQDTASTSVHFTVPSLTLLTQRTPKSQNKDGLIVSVAPVAFTASVQYKHVLAEKSANAGASFLNNLIGKPGQAQEPVNDYSDTRTPIASLNPGQLSFELTVTNNTKTTIKIEPQVRTFVDSRMVVNSIHPSYGFSMSLAPGATQTAVLNGPNNDQIFQGNTTGTILLYLMGINTDPFEPAKTVSYQWDFSYTMQTYDKMVTGQERTVSLTASDAKKLDGTIDAQ